MSEPILLPVKSVLTGVLLVFLVVLSAMVTARRAALGGIQFGDADDDVLRRRIRAHANFVEITPMIILGIGLMELAGAPSALLWGFATVFLIGRFLHFLRMSVGNPWIGLFSIITPARDLPLGRRMASVPRVVRGLAGQAAQIWHSRLWRRCVGHDNLRFPIGHGDVRRRRALPHFVSFLRVHEAACGFASGSRSVPGLEV